jgi:hypothetical protein
MPSQAQLLREVHDSIMDLSTGFVHVLFEHYGTADL